MPQIIINISAEQLRQLTANAPLTIVITCDGAGSCVNQITDNQEKPATAEVRQPMLSATAGAVQPMLSAATGAVQPILSAAAGGVQPKKAMFFEYFSHQIKITRSTSSPKTYENYLQVYNKFYRFMGEEDFPISDLNADLMRSYYTRMREQDLSQNTISFHMSILRAIYRRAVKSCLVADCHPFTKTLTGKVPTMKRALSAEEIKSVATIHLENKNHQMARDIFMFSYYCRGMSFVDMAYMKTDDLNDNVLRYNRKKTHQPLTVAWEKQMQEIIDRYPSATGKYLLPIITDPDGDERSQYRSMQEKLNKYLKEVGKMAGVKQKLTMYCARHSWATIARDNDVSQAVISTSLGHARQQTTAVYLATLKADVIDEANRKLINIVAMPPAPADQPRA